MKLPTRGGGGVMVRNGVDVIALGLPRGCLGVGEGGVSWRRYLMAI